MTSQRKKEICRLIKGKPSGGWVRRQYFKLMGREYKPLRTTRKDRRNKKFSCFEMRSCKGRTKIRKYENRKYRRDWDNLAPHKKVGNNYQHSIW